MQYKIDRETAEQQYKLYEEHFEVEPDEETAEDFIKLIMRGRVDLEGDTFIYQLKNPIELENDKPAIKQLKVAEMSGNDLEKLSSASDSPFTQIFKYLEKLNGVPFSVIGRAKKSDIEALSTLVNFF